MHAVTFGALGEPTRLRIVELLRHGPAPVGEIADVLGTRQPQVSKHLQVLRDAGIVRGESLARRRIHHLEAARFDEIGSWVDSFEQTWRARLDSLETYLSSLGPEGAGDG